MIDIEKLDQIQLDTLREAGNIGCSHAATAVSKLINKKMVISVPSIEIKKIPELSSTLVPFKESKDKIAGIYLELIQDFHGSILFFFPGKSAHALADILLGRKHGETQELTAIEESALMEVGNIVVSAYANALGKFLKTTIMLTPPTFTYNVPEIVVTKSLSSLGKETTHALIFDTELKEAENLFRSYFVLLPSLGFIDKLFDRINN